MPLASRLKKAKEKLRPAVLMNPAAAPDPRAGWKAALAILAVLNVALLLFLVRPFGGSAADLAEELEGVRKQQRNEQTSVLRLRGLLEKVGAARKEQDGFTARYFMDRRTTSSTILSEIGASADKAGLKPREHSFQIEPVEGSDTISMMTITANYEGTYGDLVEFVNLVDRSPKFIMIDSIQAAPMQQQPGMLTSRFKMNTFVKDHPEVARQAAAVAEATKPGGEGAVQ